MRLKFAKREDLDCSCGSNISIIKERLALLGKKERRYTWLNNKGLLQSRLLTKYECHLEDEVEKLQDSLFSISSHYAKIQFRLRQISCASDNERLCLLRELERITCQGIDDNKDHNDLPILLEDSKRLGNLRDRQTMIIDQIRSRLSDLSLVTDVCYCAESESSYNLRRYNEELMYDLNYDEHEKNCPCIVCKENNNKPAYQGGYLSETWPEPEIADEEEKSISTKKKKKRPPKKLSKQSEHTLTRSQSLMDIKIEKPRLNKRGSISTLASRRSTTTHDKAPLKRNVGVSAARKSNLKAEPRKSTTTQVRRQSSFTRKSLRKSDIYERRESISVKKPKRKSTREISTKEMITQTDEAPSRRHSGPSVKSNEQLHGTSSQIQSRRGSNRSSITSTKNSNAATTMNSNTTTARNSTGTIRKGSNISTRRNSVLSGRASGHTSKVPSQRSSLEKEGLRRSNFTLASESRRASKISATMQPSQSARTSIGEYTEAKSTAQITSNSRNPMVPAESESNRPPLLCYLFGGRKRRKAEKVPEPTTCEKRICQGSCSKQGKCVANVNFLLEEQPPEKKSKKPKKKRKMCRLETCPVALNSKFCMSQPLIHRTVQNLETRTRSLTAMSIDYPILSSNREAQLCRTEDSRGLYKGLCSKVRKFITAQPSESDREYEDLPIPTTSRACKCPPCNSKGKPTRCVVVESDTDSDD